MLYRGMAEPDEGSAISLEPLGWTILISAFACLAVSVALIAYSTFLRHIVEPSREQPPPAEELEQEAGAVEAVDEEPAPDLSRLSEDERKLYELIEAAGGEILQMNLVSSGAFSKSKVTRLLDKLEDRDLIKRERHGMTNMVRLTKGR
jgi:uncharacterized membrane protein